ncbi:hypothetical protein V6Z11_D07G033300 [Gossypium hirsutum]
MCFLYGQCNTTTVEGKIQPAKLSHGRLYKLLPWPMPLKAP